MTAVLIVEDDPLIAWSLSQTISDEVGADVIVATNSVGAEEHLADNLDFALLDVKTNSFKNGTISEFFYDIFKINHY